MKDKTVDGPTVPLHRQAEEYEEYAARFLSGKGFAEVQATIAVRDGRVDVRVKGVLAQVKWHGLPVGRPSLQAFAGAAIGVEDCLRVFFLRLASLMEL
ncbi:restriction endonuclease [Dietzia sp. NPDC055877]